MGAGQRGGRAPFRPRRGREDARASCVRCTAWATPSAGRPTNPGRGGSAGSTAYRLVLQGREVDLRAGENLLGRVAEGVAWIDSSSVSRRHARILVEGGAPVLEDLGSKNGTFLHGQRISAPTPLVDGDVFRLGRVSITLKALRDGATTGTDAD